MPHALQLTRLVPCSEPQQAVAPELLLAVSTLLFDLVWSWERVQGLTCG